MTTLLDHPPHVAETEDSSVLRRIGDPAINLAVWQREALPDAGPAIAALLAAVGPVAGDWHAPSARQIAGQLGFANASVGFVESFAALAADIVRLSLLFAALTSKRHPRVRLARVEDDGCALFHADTLEVRLLCLYAGPGTQWLENDNVRREQLGSRDRTLDEANAAIVVDPTAIRSIPNWHVAVFKGKAWPGGEANALVHRSAPVRHRDDHRLRLCIDLPGDCAC